MSVSHMSKREDDGDAFINIVDRMAVEFIDDEVVMGVNRANAMPATTTSIAVTGYRVKNSGEYGVVE